MSCAEDIKGLLALEGTAADRFRSSIHGRFDPDVIKRDVLSLRTQGLIAHKTPAEIRKGCREIEAKQSAASQRIKSRSRHYVGCGGCGESEWREVIESVETVMREDGLTLTLACGVVGTTVRSYRKWKSIFEKKGARS